MNRYRFREVSLIPQYAMSALNPTRKIGRMIDELLESRGVPYEEKLPELEAAPRARRPVAGRARPVSRSSSRAG